MSDEEVAVGGARGQAARQARHRACALAASRSSRRCATASSCIYHASFTDEEALDMLEAQKDRIFVAPGHRDRW